MLILLVDDHAVVRQGLEKILGENFANMEVVETSNGSEARARLRETDWDAVILDPSLYLILAASTSSSGFEPKVARCPSWFLACIPKTNTGCAY
jgi:DNA-binding NarL/FixJ family response regulator